MKNTGALLKTKRESSNLSLSEVALATKINPKILAAIENGDEANLPAKTFLKGFVRSYALFLKMDVDSVMRTFNDEMGGPPPAAPTPSDSAGVVKAPKTKAEPSAPKSRRVDEESSSGLRTVAVVVIVLLIGLIIGVRELIEKYQRERVVEASADLNKATPVTPAPVEPVKDSNSVAATAPTVAPAPDVAPDTGDTVTVESTTVPPAPKTVDTKNADTVKPPDVTSVTRATEVKPAEKVAEKVAEKTDEVKISTPPPAAIISARNLVQMPINNLVELRPTELSPPRPVENSSTPPPKSEAPKVETPKAPELPKPAETAPVAENSAETAPVVNSKSMKNEIILEALDKVEVKFQVKGETKRVSLGPTQVHTIHAELPMTLDLSDGGAVNIILNGRERGVPGDLGKPKTIRIP